MASLRSNTYSIGLALSSASLYSSCAVVKLADRVRTLLAPVLAALPTLPTMSSADTEEQQFQDEVKQIQQWWSDSRWRYTKRPFTAEQIATKRGNLKIEHPSNVLAKKLWKTVEQRFQVSVFPTEHIQQKLQGTDQCLRTRRQASPLVVSTL